MTVDVRARLAEGAAMVASQNQQTQQWYYAEDGLRLDALDADSAALAAAASTSEEAIHAQREALTVLTEAWRGGSGDGAVDFVARHCAAAEGVAAEIRSGAGVLSALSENLARVVNSKVEAVLDGSAEWAAANSTNPSAAAYEEALTRLGELSAPRFETPLPPAIPTTGPGPGRPVPTPAGLPSSPSAMPLPQSPNTGLPNFGSALAGLINQIAQALGPYSDIPHPDIPQPDIPPAEALPPQAPPPETSPPETPQTPAAEPTNDVKPVAPEEQSPADVPLAAEVPLAAKAPLLAEVAPPAEPAAVPDQPPPAPPQGPAVAADTTAGDTATPCEIAADELPQVGQ